MGKFKVYGTSSKEISQREIEHKTLARRVAVEGFVLLKNDGALPLANKKIALFGGGSKMTVKGGSGSGDVRERHSVSIEEGLRNAGFTFKTTWMDRFENKFNDDISSWKNEVNEAIKGYGPIRTMQMFIEIGKHPKPNPATILVEDGDLDDAETAVYVLSRQAGEGKDRRVEKGDYLLSDIETESLKKLSAHYRTLVLVINCGGTIDLSILDETRIDAVIFYAQGGMEGGNALADVLEGKVSPSGKLTDTWAYKYEDYPSADTFSYLNGNLDDEDYFEGIYVGYRYFETFGVKPRYPFGFGLSYTSFKYEVKETYLDGENFNLTAIVTNTGNFSGKEVLQLFISKPTGRIHTEKLSLVAFAKTNELEPNGNEELSLSFNVKDMAVFNEGAFILQQGEYGLYLGTSAEDNKVVAVLEVKEDMAVEKFHSIIQGNIAFTEFSYDRTTENYDDNLPRYTVENISPVCHKIFEPQFSEKVKDTMSRLSAKQKIMLVVGGGYKMNGYISIMGAAGRTNTSLLKYGIPNIMMSDGPAGINIIPQNACTKSGSPRYPNGLPEDWQWGWLKHVWWLVKGNPKKLTQTYRYATAFPSGTCIAQSFNDKLAEEVGRAVGKEMKEFGISVWLAPGMNIHRNPLCGRNFEYYSEDPLVSGKIAAAVTRGVQSVGGVGVSIKHFCCNNQEDNRTGVSSNLSERALREIYLRGFRIAVAEEMPSTVMSSYNRVNGNYVCNSEDLLNRVLRDEWGFNGLVMSDWDATEKCSYPIAINSGNDMIMPGTKKIRKKLYKDYKDGKLNKNALDISASRVLNMIFASHTSEGF